MKNERTVSLELQGEPWRLHRQGMMPAGAAMHYFVKGVVSCIGGSLLLTLIVMMAYAIGRDQHETPSGAPGRSEAIETPRERSSVRPPERANTGGMPARSSGGPVRTVAE